MNQPIEPFRIAGNLYYVGASDVTSFLVTTDAGHILIDGGFAETAALIEQSLAQLGFDIQDVKILLNSHSHLDHAGGLARLKERSGAQLWASAGDAPYLESGGAGDPILGDKGLFPRVEVDRRLQDGDSVELGGMKLTARVTAGHTPGCTTWTMSVMEGGRTYAVASICSLTILPGVQLTDEPTWPGIAEDFERSFKILRATPCEIFLAAHGSFFGLEEKRQAQRDGARHNPFIDSKGYRAYVKRAAGRYRERVAEERKVAGRWRRSSSSPAGAASSRR
jgi:metallo-beta-lactamase class B